MGELENYYIILSEVKYADDPMKYGRIKCDIPGVIHSSTILPEAYPDAMPWVRPFKMYCYQTFTRPIVGQKVWVLCSKTNYNEYWWFPFYETLDFVQKFIEENYDNQPDVMHARQGSSGEVIFTYDDEHGYIMKLADDYLNLRPNREMKIAFNDCRIMIEGNLQYSGGGDDHGSYEPCVMGYKCQNMRSQMAGEFNQLATKAAANPYTSPLSPHFAQIAKQLGSGILGKYHWVN